MDSRKSQQTNKSRIITTRSTSMAASFELHKETLHKLYVVEGKKLDHVVEYMMEQYGFERRYQYGIIPYEHL